MIAICTIAEGPLYHELAKITHPLLHKYASKVGAYFVPLQRVPGEPPHFAKFKIYELFEKFDRILFIDTDILIRPDAPNLFDLVPPGKSALVEEGHVEPRKNLIENLCSAYNFSSKNLNTSRYFNTGVMLLDRAHRNVVAPWSGPFKSVDGFYEQTFINYRLAKLPTSEIMELDPKFNWMSCFQKNNLARTEGWFIHYAGFSVQRTPKQFLQAVAEDRAAIDSTYTKPPRKIALKIDGGLGDHVAAEPAVRYACEHLFKSDDVIIISHFPEIFEHIDRKHFVPGKDYIEDSAEREIRWSMPPVESVEWNILSHGLVNAYDYASILLLKGQLPVAHREIHLAECYYNYQDSEFPAKFEQLGITSKDWRKIVLVHPGRGWPSKTFPAHIWGSYVKEILDAGFTPCLIGKDIDETQGVVALNIPGVLDLTGKLSLRELIAAISQARFLLTNDSAPLHIAGAFHNYTGIIASCKRPEFLIPYRKPSILEYGRNVRQGAFPFYESLEGPNAFYNKISRDPLATGLVTMDKWTEQEMWDTLPTPERIRDWLKDLETYLNVY